VPHLRHPLRFLARPALAERAWRPILVSDCKMVTPEAVLACHDHNLFYLGALTYRRAAEAVLRSDRRIAGMVFISLPSLLVRAILERACRQHGLSVTAERLFRAFASLQAVDLT